VTRLMVAGEVGAAFPGLRIDAVVADGFSGWEPWPEVEERLAALEAGTAAGEPVASGEDDPHITSWHAAYRAFGTNPKRQRPSVDALRRRLARTGRLPRINPAVDCYNLISAASGVPAGAFDLRLVSGDITVRFADGSEPFTPLGEPGTVENPQAGEVVYADAAGVLTRHWNHRDAERTKVTVESDRIVFLLETVEQAAFGAAVEAASVELASLVHSRSDAVAVYPLTAESPVAMFE
jgi:DNA/RNA-binding domain of Phe-tRNA-synthetase-like protein